MRCFAIMSFSFIFFTCTIQSQYWIRDARIDDKKKMIDVYKKSRNFYDGSLVDTGIAMSQSILDCLHSSIDEGFAFVIESLSVGSNGQILGFLLKHRSLHAACRHVVCGGIMAIDPNFRDEMLEIQLYQHLLEQVELHHCDVLRIEGNCPDCAVDLIALFELCGFVCEGRRERAVLMIGKKVVDELVFVWWNKNFDINKRYY
ncbi:MAG: hypothetical protein Q8Q60_00195 [Candidatus Chromulinivorax sp.]|nr:hypothetical protein [Candidatus Chromulinivorax sp.]